MVVVAPVIFTWFTTSPGKSNADFDRLLNAGKTYYDSGEAQKAIDAFSQALQHKPTETDLLLNLANAHRLATNPRRSSIVPAKRWLSTATSEPGISSSAALT